MSPLDVARRMLRANCDPGLIAAYLALELERDPTIGMTPIQRIGHAAQGVMRQVGLALGIYGKAFESVGRALQRQGDYMLAAPGGER